MHAADKRKNLNWQGPKASSFPIATRKLVVLAGLAGIECYINGETSETLKEWATPGKRNDLVHDGLLLGALFSSAPDSAAAVDDGGEIFSESFDEKNIASEIMWICAMNLQLQQKTILRILQWD